MDEILEFLIFCNTNVCTHEKIQLTPFWEIKEINGENSCKEINIWLVCLEYSEFLSQSRVSICYNH